MAKNPLVVAAKAGDLAEIKRRLDAGDNINAKDDAGDTALHWAAWNGDAAAVSLLVARGADVSVKNSSVPWLDYTAAMVAELNHHPEISTLLNAPKPPPPPEPGERWVTMDGASLALDGVYPAIGKRLTYVFNFESRERVLMTENLRTRGEAVSPPTSFDDLPESLVEKVYGEFTSRGGKADRDFVFKGISSLNKKHNLPPA